MSDQPPVRRIGIVGDVHAEHGRLAEALQWLHGQRVDAVICTGDVADGPGDVDLCCRLLDEAAALTVRGNHDRWLLQDRVRHIAQAHRREDLLDASIEFLDTLPATIEIDTVAGALLLCHGVGGNDLRKVWPGTERMPIERSAELDALVAEGRTRFLVNGHMHYRVLIDFHGLTLLNAGTLTSRHRPGISVADVEAGAVSAYEFAGERVGGRVAERPLDADPQRRVWRDTQEFDGNWLPVALYAPR